MDTPSTPSFWRRRIADPLIGLLKQGITPEKLALALALGIAVGISPAFGLTTLLCIPVAALFRVNQVAIQITNWLVYPLQFVLLLPFIRIGEHLTRSAPASFSVREFVDLAKAHPGVAVKTFGVTLMNAYLGWLAFGIVITVALYYALTPLLRRWKF